MQPLGEIRLGDVVSAGASAANIRFGQFDVIASGGAHDEFARLQCDPLRVGEVARVVISRLVAAQTRIHFQSGFGGEQFGKIHDSFAELSGASGVFRIVMEEVAVFLERGAATGGVNYDCVHVGRFEDFNVFAG